MKIKPIHGLVIALAFALPLRAMADSAKADDAKEHHGHRGRLFLVLRIADALNLSDEKTLAVNHVLQQAEEKRHALREQRMAVNKQIHDALGQSKPDEAALTKLIDQAIDLDHQQQRAGEDAFNSLKKILTVPEQAKLVLLRSKLRHEVGFHGHGGRRWGGMHGGWHHGDGMHDRGRESAGPEGMDREE
jgi:Spy/CpxP family protein refolding chaperone